MVQIFIIFLVIILVLAAIVGAAVAFRGHSGSGSFLPTDRRDGAGEAEDIDRQYYDDAGRHIYYDRSSIEKAEFIRRHPDEKPRSLSRLFSRRRN